MVYDGEAVIDHLTKVDDDTVMGIMNSRSDRANGKWFYFWLERGEAIRVV